MNKLHLFSLSVILIIVSVSAGAQTPGFISGAEQQNHWVDSVFKKLSRKRKIEQLFFVRAHTNKGQAYEDSVGKVIKKEQLGGVVFFQGGPVRQAELINRYQSLAWIPLIVSMDVNNNPNNPVINYRSFGDNKYNVAQKGIAYMQGMQSAGLLTTAKHFPGHGDTDVDSHMDLPQLNFTTARLDSLEEYPFREAVKAGISGIMVAHMNIPALDTTKNLPSTLSRPIVTGVLKESLGFKGLVVSDAMEMKGVVKFFPNGQADVNAFIAGNDILELSENSHRAMKMIKKAIRKDKIKEEELDARVKKVLAAKYWVGLNHYQPARLDGINADLNRADAYALQQELADNAVTLLKGDTTIQNLDKTKRTAIVSIGTSTPTVYQQELAKSFTDSKLFFISKEAQTADMTAILNQLKEYDQIIVGVHDTRVRPASKLDYSSNLKLMIADLASYKNTVISVFANPYTIAGLPGIEKSSALLACYQKEAFMQRAAAKVIAGQIKAKGKLSVSVNMYFPNGSGIVASGL